MACGTRPTLIHRRHLPLVVALSPSSAAPITPTRPSRPRVDPLAPP